MFWSRRRASDETMFLIVKEHLGLFTIVTGQSGRAYRDARSASREAARLASNRNDGRYFVFQAVSVSEVCTPSAVTRPIGNLAMAREQQQLSSEPVLG